MNTTDLNKQFGKKATQEILKWALDTFGDRLTVASSFGHEDVVLIHILAGLGKKFRVITLDTGRLPQETYEVMERVREQYNVSIESYFPEKESVEALTLEKGFYSFRESIENRKECCRIRKVDPLKRALKNASAWMTGQRRDQSLTRNDLQVFEEDQVHGGILKINPLMDWSEERVREFVRMNRLPYNRLFDQGYRSIGCAPCTRAVKAGESERAGRWWWENPDQKECGIHRS